MLACISGRRMLVWLAALVAVSCASGRVALAQLRPGDSIPSSLYFNSLRVYNDGNYRDALAVYQNELRTGIKWTPTSRWIDSICYFTMAGECYYQMGQLPQALEQYESALKLYVAYSDWMMRVQFPPAIMPAQLGAVRATPWGQSKRGARVGQFPDTFLLGQGQVDQSQVLQRGGVVQAAQLITIHVSEIVRCTTLAMRRRRDLLGPLGKHDPLTSNLIDVLARRPGPPNHWSEAWVNVQLGCAYAAAGNAPQAKTALERAVLVNGEYDHPLTSTALLELARLAFETADYPAAGRYCEEASYACVNFTDLGNLEEAFRMGLLAHVLLNQKRPFPPLAPAMPWAKSQAGRHLQASLLLLGAENVSSLGDAAQAGGLLTSARQLIGRSDLANSQLGARLNHLSAVTAYQAGNLPAGDQAIAAALDFQRHGSQWMFQIAKADGHYTKGDYSDRVGLLAYEAVLREPTPADWASNPLECLSILTLPHPLALEHWFELALKNNKDADLAMEIGDRARRHRYLTTLPLGGRLLSLRWILEGPAELLGQAGLLQRQDLLARYPKYAQLAAQANAVHAQLDKLPLADQAANARRDQANLLASLADTSAAQEQLLREIAVRREPAQIVFPPLRKTKDIQQQLPEGHVLLAFFATERNLYAFLYSREKYASWRVQSPLQVQRSLTQLLRELGNYDTNHEVVPADLAKSNWRATGNKIMSLLFDRSNVDLAGNFEEIVIVPDAALWYLPFEALNLPRSERSLIAQARVRYAPTVGLAIPYGHAQKPRPKVGVVVGKLHPQDEDAVAQEAFEEFSHSVEGATALPAALPAPSALYRTLLDSLVVLDDIEPGDGPYGWSPAQLDRGKSGAALADWFQLPWGGPESLILPGFHTAAENGLKKNSAAGNELFLSLCGLMSTGARTVLISRWRTAGQTSFDLMREFAQELPHASPAEAWQRSVQIAAETQIDPAREPRVKKSSSTAEPPKADHPFFWAGYLLADCGRAPAGEDKLLAVPGLNVPRPPQTANPQANPPRPGAAPAPMPAAGAAADPLQAEPPVDKPTVKGKRPVTLKPKPARKPKAKGKSADMAEAES